MPIHNSDIADIFNRVADLLDIEGENQFRIRAYRNAARVVGGLPQNIADMVKEGEDLTQFSGIGTDLAGKIKEIVETGTLNQLKELEGKTPSELSRLMKIEGLGPKRVQVLHRKLGISDLDGLKKAAEKNKIQKVQGFGKKTERMILEALEKVKEEGEKKRFKLLVAGQIANDYVDYLKKEKGVKDIAVAGSYRRRKETVGDLDILVTCKKGSKVMDRFVKYGDVAKVVSKGTTRSSVVLRSGLHVDLRVVPRVSYGAALHYFTGSKDHNIAVRSLGVKRGLKINEYGVFKGKKEKRVAGGTEKEVYKQVNLPYIEPELRENWGEIEAAQKGNLPELITIKDIRGDLHVHTKETDGRQSLEKMVQGAKDCGKTVKQLVKKSMVNTIADLYKLSAEDLLKLEGFAKKSATQLYEAIQATKKPRLDRFLYALGIRHNGERVARVLTQKYRSLNALKKANKKELREIPEVGPEIAESVENFFKEKENKKVLDQLAKAGIKVEATPAPKELPLKGETLVFTGSLKSYTRSEVKRKVESLGGRATSGVSGETDYVVAGENPRSKLDEAKKQKVKIIDEEEFKKLVGGQSTL